MVRMRDVAEIFRAAAIYFSNDTVLSAFLDMVSAQESQQAQFLDEIAGSGQIPPAEEMRLHLNAATLEELDTTFASIGKGIEERTLNREGILEYLVNLKSSPLHALFLYLVEGAAQCDEKFQPLKAETARHRQTIAAFLGGEPQGEAYLQRLNSLSLPRRKRILILDDDPVVANLMAILISPYGDVEVSNNGREALARFTGEPFDLIVSDYNMPEMNGMEFYHEAVSSVLEFHGAFLFYSGAFDEHFEQFARETGVPCLQKPSPINEIHDTVTRLLQGGRGSGVQKPPDATGAG